MVHIASNIVCLSESKVYRIIKNAVCIIVYLPVFLVILDTVIVTQFKLRILHVPNLIPEVTALRCGSESTKFDSLKLNTTLSNV